VVFFQTAEKIWAKKRRGRKGLQGKGNIYGTDKRDFIGEKFGVSCQS